MRKILIVATILAPSLAQAAVITEQGELLRGYSSVENGYILVYNFAPLAIPGNVVSFQLDYSGFVSARVGGASGINIATGNTITSVTLTPTASFASSLASGPSLGFQSDPTVLGAQITSQYDNINNISISSFATPLTLTGISGSGVPNDTFNVPNLAAVSLGTLPGPSIIIVKPSGSTADFPGGVDVDRSSGGGSLLLTVTYNPIPEPISSTLLGGALEMMILSRRKST